MKPQNVVFPCGNMELEGLLYKPGAVAQSAAVAVCHPHPLYGGSMHNNVTFALAEALVKGGMAALLFNFRGVGRSGGSYAGGIGEKEDIAAALDMLEGEADIDSNRLGLAGYSFGAGMALPVGCRDDRVRAMVLVSPYCEEPPSAVLVECRKPKLFIGGGRDSMVPEGDVRGYYEAATGPREIWIDGGADHFWGGREGKMAGAVADFFRREL